jgi:hypothetical protein
MINQELLEKAKHKFKTSNDDIPLYGYIHDLVIECYVRYEPSKRGKTLQKLIINYLNEYGVKSPDSWNNGDFFIKPKNLIKNRQLYNINNYLHSNELSKKIGNKKKINSIIKGFSKRVYESVSTFFEIKTSYLNSGGYYSINNIRTYQNYEYLILLLVDCEYDFKYRLIMIPKSELGGIKMSHMHGTKESNNGTKNPHLSFSIKKGSEFERSLNRWCVYGGFNSLKMFCKECYDKVLHNILTINEEQYNYIVNDEIKTLLNDMGVGYMSHNNGFEVIPYIYKKFRKLKKMSWGRGESYWDDENGDNYFYYQNRAFVVNNFIFSDISKEFNLTYDEVKNYLSTYFDRRYPSLKHLMILRD